MVSGSDDAQAWKELGQTGIWNDVYLSVSGPVTIENPFVTTALPLPDTTRADVSVEVTLRNHEARAVAGTLSGRFGDVAFQTPVTVEAAAAKTVKLDASTHPALRLQNPKLWWPVGYGDPNLYPVELNFERADRRLSDTASFHAGVRQFAYSEEGGVLKIWINGRRFVPVGTKLRIECRLHLRVRPAHWRCNQPEQDSQQ